MKKRKVGIVIQARMGSTRLPGKVLKKIYKDDSVLDILIKRVKVCKEIDEIIIATTPDKKNSSIINLAKSYNVSYFIGSEENVLERYYKAAKSYDLDIIIRVTSDCPFIDPKILDEMIITYKNNNYDCLRNSYVDTNFSIGLTAEIFSFTVLEDVFRLAKTTSEKEHVTPYIYSHDELFSIVSFDKEDLKKFKDLRLTIDEEDDLKLCREVYKSLMAKCKSINFSVYDLIEIIEENPELMDINKHVKQKNL